MEHSTVLITGGSGFLGQHLYRVLQEKSESIKEIRILDLFPFANKFDVDVKIPTKHFVGDITQIDESSLAAFRGVDAVIHCASRVSYKYPADSNKLHQVNVQGTRNVINLCVEFGVRYLVYTSSAEACIVPYFRNGFFSVIVNTTESKFHPPDDSSQLVFGEYARSKLEGEKIVLEANGAAHKSGSGCLKTVSLRPAILYGEHDTGFLPLLIRLGCQLGDILWRVGGPGGKHQFCYAGNAAWAHLCALKTLQNNPAAIEGLPVNVTDDTFICDQLRFCEKLTTPRGKKPLMVCSWWYIPAFLSFLLAVIYESACSVVKHFSFQVPQLPASPKTLVIYLGSVVCFYRLRAAIHINYSPIYSALDAYENCRNYYIDWLMEHRKQANSREKVLGKSYVLGKL